MSAHSPCWAPTWWPWPTTSIPACARSTRPTWISSSTCRSCWLTTRTWGWKRRSSGRPRSCRPHRPLRPQPPPPADGSAPVRRPPAGRHRPVDPGQLRLDGRLRPVQRLLDPGRPHSRQHLPHRHRSIGESVMTKAIPDAPGYLPLIGHAVPLARHRTEFLASLASRGDLVRIGMANLPAYVPTNPGLVWQILVSDHKSYARGRMFDKMTDVLGYGLATTSGQVHHEIRRMLQPTFHHQKVASYAPIMTGVAEAVAGEWEPGQPFRVDQAMNDLTARVVNGILFASDLGAAAADAIQQRLPVVMRGMLTRTLIPGGWQRLPLPANKRYRQAIAEMDNGIDQAIAAYRASGHQLDDMLSALLALRDSDGNPMPDTWIHDQVITVAVGGIETTSAALSWCLHHIGTKHEVE